MKVFSYLRVSGRGQVDGDGFPRQRSAIAELCAKKGWTVLREFKDGGVSGTNELEDRKQMAEMVSVMGPATSMTFVVESAERLARDLIVSELIVQDMRERGFTVHSAAGDMDLTTSDEPSRVFIRQILGAVAQYDKSNLVRKLRAARDRKRQRGERCEGPKPYELRDAKGAEVCQSVYEMRTRGLTFKEIAQWLSQTKTPTPAGKLYWHKSSVESIYARYSRRFHAVAYGDKPNPNQILVDLRHVLPESQV